ncbi:hypothetical protein [Desulfobacter hydrogenophilus]|nr:hypothetical protein [Desulfobacter hydrogenophilus]QBH13730.1 hypothetical protein EYB58_12850 [Desulfobacter hydrogenophilus]
MPLVETPAVSRIFLHIDVDKDVWFQVDLHATVTHPQVAQFQAVSQGETKVISPTVDARPTLYLGDKSVCGEEWTLTVRDPFGRKHTQRMLADCEGTP